MRREPLLAALLCLVGAFLVLVATTNAWAQVAVPGTGLLPGRDVDVTGSELVPGVRALGLVALAGVVAIPATKRWGRTAVGLVLALVGAGVVAAVLGVTSDIVTAAQDTDVVREAGGAEGESTRRTVWPYACLLGGLAILAAGLFVAVRGRRWAALGRRYDAPATQAAEPAPERDLWEALDRGDDPTAADAAAADPEGQGPTPRG